MAKQRPGNSGQLRIIGGRWRGRKLRFPAAPGLRPTPDRVRETLFNWLGGQLPGARCIDLFAGSGALGLEALSRGAGHCCFVDNNGPGLDVIGQHLALLECGDGQCRRADAMSLLAGGNRDTPYDIAFLDPPFDAGLLAPACEVLNSHGWLADDAMVYVESSVRDPEFVAPPGWNLHRDKRAGEVRYRLFVRGTQFV